MLESQRQHKVLKYLETLPKVWACKIVVGNKSGIPDIIGVLDGKFFAIEMKTPKGKLSKIQEWVRELIEEANGLYLVATNVKQVKEFINEQSKL